jgi:hypothetical protein
MFDTVSVKSIKAQMPHVTLMRILGEPSHCQLKQLERKLTNNLMAVPCSWGNKGHLGLFQNPILYQQHNSAAFTIPAAAPPAYPVIVAGATTAEREEQRANKRGSTRENPIFQVAPISILSSLIHSNSSHYDPCKVWLKTNDHFLICGATEVHIFVCTSD